jgi:hypothetical protein
LRPFDQRKQRSFGVGNLMVHLLRIPIATPDMVFVKRVRKLYQGRQRLRFPCRVRALRMRFR